MRVDSLSYDLKTKKWSAPFPAVDSARTMVLAFGDPKVVDDAEPIRELRRAFPTSLVAGCSGSGEIVGTAVKDDVIAVSVVSFERTQLGAAANLCKESAQSFTVGEALGKKLNKPSLRSVFVLSDGLNVNGSELVRGINSVLDESVVVTGGLAGDGTRFQRTWVSLGDTVASGLVVAIGFYGDHLLISHGSKGGWDKFGPERIVTRAKGNVLYELDGKPALALYKEYLGDKAAGLPATGLLFPLSLRANAKDDKALVRTLLAVDEAKQSMTFAGDVPQGFLAQLMKADFDRLIGGAASAATTARKLVGLDDPNTFAIAVSCVGRRLVLGERTEEEVEAVFDVLPKGSKVTGFYSYGELSPFATGRCDLHNQTMTLTTFTELATPVTRAAKPAAVSSPAGATATGPVMPVAPPVRPVTPPTTLGAGLKTETLSYDVKTRKWSAPFPAMDSPRTLVLAFGDPSVVEAPGCLQELRRAYPQSVVAGCSGSGEIVGTTVKDDVVSVSVVRFERTDLSATSAECKASAQSFSTGEALGKKLNQPSLRAVFVLSDGLNVNGSELVRGINSALDDSVVVTGGLAGDGTRFQRTWVSLGDTVASGLVVAIGFYGDHLIVSHGSKGGWDKFGPERVVTRAEGNVLYELDGKPALALYKEYLGDKASGLPATGLLFPLSLRANAKDDKALVRTLLAVDEARQSMTFAGDVPSGFLAQLMKADFDRLIGGAASAATTARKLVGLDDPHTFAIAVSCVGRRLVLGERTEEEVEAVLDVLPKGAKVTGFYSYGELSPFATGRCDLHNQTMTLTTFTESATPVARAAKPAAATVAPSVAAPSPAAPAPSGLRIEPLTYDLKTKKWSAPFPALDSPRTLVLAFGDPSVVETPGCLQELRRAFPTSVVAGCSGSGEIVGTAVKDDVVSVSISRFERTDLISTSAECKAAAQSFSTGEALGQKLNKPSLRAVFVLSDGLNVNGSELVRGINSVLDEAVVVTGGLAGDGTRFQRTWVSLGDTVASGLVVAIGFYGDHLVVSHGSKGGWDKFGPERIVTRAEGNVLYELDGKPALALYKEYLGDKASGLPATGLLFPLSLRANAKDDKALVRTLLAVDEAKQSMTFAGDMPQGFLAQMMKADFDRLIGGAATAATTAKKLVAFEDPNTLAIAVSCVGRRLVLGERTEEEVEAVLDVLPKGSKVTGFYSYGELSPFATGRCDLHNQTMTLTTFAESPTPVARVARPAPAPVAKAPAPPPLPPAPAAKPSSRGVFEDLEINTSDTMPLSKNQGLGVNTLTYDLKTKKWSAPFPPMDSARTLVLAFGDPAVVETPEPLKELRRAYPNSVVAGCSGSGEIVGTTVKDDVLSVSITRFEHTSIAAASAECQAAAGSFTTGEAVGKKLHKPSLRAVFVLSDGLNVNGSELVRGINSVLDDSVVVTGGLAGDGTRFQRTWVSLGDTVTSGLVVAIGFYGDHLIVSHGSKGGWDKFGPERVVTRAEGNVLYELDHKPALALYKEYLGDKASGLPATGLLFPLSLRANAKDDKALVRTLLAVDEAKQSMTFAGDMPQGFLAQMMKADFDRLIGGAATAASTARKLVSLDDPHTLAIAVSCVGRRLVLGERTEEEVEAVLDVLPKGAKVTGFYSYGELSPFATGRCDLHNQTMTITTFAESPTPLAKVARSMPTAQESAPRQAAPPPVASAPTPVAPPPAASAPPAANRSTERRVTRALSADRTPAGSATIEIDRSGEVTIVRIKGKLSESFKGREISSAAGAKLLFDLPDVERITSFGVREWLQLLTDLEQKGTQLFFSRCSEAVVNQLGMIRRFSGGGLVHSFFAPYQCSACSAQFSALIDCEADIDVLKQKVLPPADCPSCAQAGHFDDDARSYLAFGPVAITGLDPEVRKAIDALPPVGVLDPIEKSIDGRTNRVRVNCRIDENVRWSRVLDGTEGELVLELGASPGSSAAGATALVTALKKLPADVDSIRLEGCPGSVLEAIAQAGREKRLTVVTATVEAHCATCNAPRPAPLRVEEALEAVASGKDPYVVCKRCNAQLDFSAVRGTLRKVGETAAPAPAPAAKPVAPAIVAAPVAPVAAAPAASPLPLAPPPSRGFSPAMLVASGIGLTVVVLLVVLISRTGPQPAPLAPPPVAPPVAVVAPPRVDPAPAPTPVAPPAADPASELPPAWSEQPFLIERDVVYVVGKATGAASEEEALQRARSDAEFRLVQHMLEAIAGTRTHEFVTAKGTDDWAANAEPIVGRFSRQVGAIAAPQRSDASLHKKAAGVEGVVRYRLAREAWDKALEFYRATGTGFGLTTARFFPGLEASMRTEGEVIVVSAGRGLAFRAGLREGDVIAAIDGRPVPNLDVFNRLVREVAVPGGVVTFGVESAGAKRQLRMAIPRPEESPPH